MCAKAKTFLAVTEEGGRMKSSATFSGQFSQNHLCNV